MIYEFYLRNPDLFIILYILFNMTSVCLGVFILNRLTKG